MIMARSVLQWFRVNKYRLQGGAYSLLGGLMLLMIVRDPGGQFVSKVVGLFVAIIAIVGGLARALRPRSNRVEVETGPTLSHKLGEARMLLLIVFVYWVTSGATYVAWSELVGWPVMTSEFGLRAVHLIPAFIGTILAAGVAGVNTRMRMSLAPGLILGGGIALAHFLSYSNVFRHAGWHYILAAATEAIVLLAASVVSHRVMARRGGES